MVHVITNLEILHGMGGSLSNFLDVILLFYDLVMDTRYDKNNYYTNSDSMLNNF